MYSHPGEYVTDFCIVRHDGQYHLFHIRGERWTWPLGYREIDLGHATSTDLYHWAPQAPVLPAGPPGSWDEAGIWAPDIVESDGVFYLFYTGSDAQNNQKIGLATSTDLCHWTKHAANPVVVPGPWSDVANGWDVAGRDGMVYADHGRYLMYYTATMADGRACIALAQSRDLLSWEDLGPTYIEEDRTYNRCESAYLVARDGRYYLFYSAKGGPKSKGHEPSSFDHFDIVYLVSDSPTGGWAKPANHELLCGGTCASEHPTFDGQTYMLYVIQEEIEGIWGASVLSDPKILSWTSDGAVQIREYLPENLEQRALFSGGADAFAAWVHHGGRWQVEDGDSVSSPGGAGDAYLMDTLWGSDLALEADVWTSSGSVASLVVRGNPSALAGYRISLDFQRQAISFVVRFPGVPDTPLQVRPAHLSLGCWYRIKVVVRQKYFEIYLNDVLTMVQAQHVFASGCFGLHARGVVRFRNVRAQAYQGLGEPCVEWQSHCRPRHLFPGSVQ